MTWQWPTSIGVWQIFRKILQHDDSFILCVAEFATSSHNFSGSSISEFIPMFIYARYLYPNKKQAWINSICKYSKHFRSKWHIFVKVLRHMYRFGVHFWTQIRFQTTFLNPNKISNDVYELPNNWFTVSRKNTLIEDFFLWYQGDLSLSHSSA